MMANQGFNYDYLSQQTSTQAAAGHGIDIAGQETMQQNLKNWLGYTSGNIFERWLHPGEAERAAFYEDNYFLDKENAFSEYMWNKSNEYNDPSKQMERLIAAGVNPALAAAQISGGQASPVTGGAAQAQMNTNAENPMDTILKGVQAIGGGVDTANTLGTIFGFGKENKSRINQITKDAENLAATAGMTKEQTRQTKKLFPLLYKNTWREGKQLEQNVKNLRQLYKLYKEQTKTQEKITDLTEEQVKTQTQQTQNLQYQNWTEKFYKELRDIFGVDAREKDVNMIVQAIMSDKGDKIIDGLSSFITKTLKEIFGQIMEHNPITKGVRNIRDWWDRNKPQPRNRFRW